MTHHGLRGTSGIEGAHIVKSIRHHKSSVSASHWAMARALMIMTKPTRKGSDRMRQGNS
jgi:hypothetical protein